MKLSLEEKIKWAEDNCLCYRCMTYINARPAEGLRAEAMDKVVKTYTRGALGPEESVYCLRGKSKVITSEHKSTCNCTGTGFIMCPVRDKFGVSGTFHCISSKHED